MMEIETGHARKLFRLNAVKPINGYHPIVLSTGRYLIGRTESCDIIIPASVISSVHAVMEVTANSVKIYDMNSKNGTHQGGKKVVAVELSLNDKVSFGNIEFSLLEYNKEEALPPVLDSLEPLSGNARISNPPAIPVAPVDLPLSSPKEVAAEPVDEVPYIVYPLSNDPRSDYSQYIFEDAEDLYPIFKYELNKQSVEVIILFSDRVYSVDYLPETDGVFKISGSTSKSKEIEFPYLAKNETVDFIEVSNGNCNVTQLHNYKLLHLSDNKINESKTGVVNLQEHDIVKLSNGELEIYIRKVSAPPLVKPAPIFRRDKELGKYIMLILLFLTLVVAALSVFEVDEKLDDQKDPDRIATILYKQKMVVNKNKTVEQTKKKPVKKQTAPKKQVVKKSEPKKTQATSQKSNVKTAKTTPNPGSKKATKVQKVKRVKNPTPKKNNSSKRVAKNPGAKKSVKSAQSRRANVKSANKGRVDVYKSFDFKSSVNTLMAKGGSLRGATTSASSSNSISNSSISGGVATNLKTANAGTAVGSLTGSAVGKLGESRGTKGLSAKTGVYTAGIPSETIILGSMDPDIIRKILRDNIPFFRSCYQKELDARGGSKISGTIRLVFSIGASGHVSRAGVDGRTKLPIPVKRCVVNVLRGIKFPRPMGGGTVDVKQPFNFMPKRL